MAEGDGSENLSLHSSDDAEEIPPPKELTWREKLAQQLATNKVQYTIIALVVLDSVIVVFELLLDMGIIKIPEDDHHHHEVSANGSAHLASNSHHLSQDPHTSDIHLLDNQSRSHGHNLLHSAISATLNGSRNVTGLHESGAEGGEEAEHEEEPHAPNKHLTEHILHMGSLVILSIFLVEVVMKILAEGTHLLKHKAEVFDAVVVVVSFTMDITFTFVNVSKATQDYSGLLVLLRLWRVTRIINGVILSVKMDADKKLNAQKALRFKAERQVKRLTDRHDKLKIENEKLRAKIAALEAGSESGRRSTQPDDRRSGRDSHRTSSSSAQGDRHSSFGRESGSSSATSPQGDQPFCKDSRRASAATTPNGGGRAICRETRSSPGATTPQGEGRSLSRETRSMPGGTGRPGERSLCREARASPGTASTPPPPPLPSPRGDRPPLCRETRSSPGTTPTSRGDGGLCRGEARSLPGTVTAQGDRPFHRQPGSLPWSLAGPPGGAPSSRRKSGSGSLRSTPPEGQQLLSFGEPVVVGGREGGIAESSSGSPLNPALPGNQFVAACGCQKKSVVYETECRHAAVQRGVS